MKSLYAFIHEKCVEPVKRNKDGVKWIVHRFPIKNGISLRDAWMTDLCRPNQLYERIKADFERKVYLEGSGAGGDLREAFK